jgi:hypothetical protein
MAATITHCRKKGSGNRREAERQLDLFATEDRAAIAKGPTWRELPEAARTDLTRLITRLMLEHAAGAGSNLRREVHDDL